MLTNIYTNTQHNTHIQSTHTRHIKHNTAHAHSKTYMHTYPDTRAYTHMYIHSTTLHTPIQSVHPIVYTAHHMYMHIHAHSMQDSTHRAQNTHTQSSTYKHRIHTGKTAHIHIAQLRQAHTAHILTA